MNTQDFLNKEELSQILGGANSENILSENEEQDILLKPSCTGPSCSNSCYLYK